MKIYTLQFNSLEVSRFSNATRLFTLLYERKMNCRTKTKESICYNLHAIYFNSWNERSLTQPQHECDDDENNARMRPRIVCLLYLFPFSAVAIEHVYSVIYCRPNAYERWPIVRSEARGTRQRHSLYMLCLYM